jgi:flavin-dependent dehydrogenase
VLEALEGRFVEKWGARLFSSDGAISRYIEFGKGYVPGHPRAFQVLRSEFDTLLLGNARRKGAEVHEGVAVLEALPSSRNGCEITVRGEDGSASRHRARFLLDASGREAFIATRRRLRDMTPHLRKAAVFAHYEGVVRAQGRAAGDIVLIILRDGWFWLIPLPGGITSVGLVMEGSTLKSCSLSPQRLLEGALESCPAAWERVCGARRISEVHSASDYSYRCREISGDGYLLLGDAAAFIDPVFSTGVWLAMSSGEMAADTLHSALGKTGVSGALSPSAFSGYERKVKRHVRLYTRIVSRFYQPGFMDLFLRPASRYGITESVISLLAGMAEPPLSVLCRLEVFYSAVRLHRRFRLAPAIPLLKVLEKSSLGASS